MTDASMQRPAESDRPLVYVVDWLPPDFGAVGQYARLRAEAEADRGRRVTLIGLTKGERVREDRPAANGGRLVLIKLKATSADKSNYATRLVWSLLTNARLLAAVLRTGDLHGTELRFTGSPPFMLFFAVLAKWLSGARLTYRITDFYPEVVIATLGRASLALRWLQALTWWARRQVDRFEAIGEDQKVLLVNGGIPETRIKVLRDPSPVQFGADTAPDPGPPELEGRIKLLYSGNFGVAHDTDTLLEGLTEYQAGHGDRIGFWFNGTGAPGEALVASLRARSIPTAQTGPVPLDRLPSILMGAEAHLITLKSAFSGIVLPSKVYGCIASGRPILFVGPESSDVHLLCSEAKLDWYRRVEPGDIAGMSAALDALAGHLPASRAAGQGLEVA